MSSSPRTHVRGDLAGKYPQANLLPFTEGEVTPHAAVLGGPPNCASMLVTCDRKGPLELASLQLCLLRLSPSGCTVPNRILCQAAVLSKFPAGYQPQRLRELPSFLCAGDRRRSGSFEAASIAKA